MWVEVVLEVLIFQAVEVQVPLSMQLMFLCQVVRIQLLLVMEGLVILIVEVQALSLEALLQEVDMGVGHLPMGVQ